ncbi:hypothetical protein H4R19_006180 [Coemansia spiralis]|nr:hypothetical protein H4R19_006180 [Coemansia spiralis]
MSGVYSALLEHAARTPSGAHSPVLAAAAAGEALRKRIQMMLVRDVSAYEVLCAAAPVTRAGVRPFASGPDLRRRLLGLAAHAAYNGPGGLQVPDLADALCSDPAGPAAHAPAASHDIGRALERIFAHGNVPPGALVQRALDRAAEDIALARTRLRSQPLAEHDGAQSPTSAPHAMPVMARCVALGPGDDDGGLGSLVGAARVLSGLWADGPVGAGALELRSGLADATSQRARAPKSRSTTAPPGPGEQGTAPTWPLTSAPSASSPRPGAAEAPRPATMDAFAAASAQPHSPPVARHRTLDSQAKKGKARKRGF